MKHMGCQLIEKRTIKKKNLTWASGIEIRMRVPSKWILSRMRWSLKIRRVECWEMKPLRREGPTILLQTSLNVRAQEGNHTTLGHKSTMCPLYSSTIGSSISMVACIFQPFK